MTPFTFDQLKTVVETYRHFVGVRRVSVQLMPLGGHTLGRALRIKRFARKPWLIIRFDPKALKYSRRAQIGLVVHELCHLRPGGHGHGRVWQRHAYLWGSAFQMRYVQSDELNQVHIEKGCYDYAPPDRCRDCKERSPIISNP